MAIVTADNFSYQGKKPLDARLVADTLSDLLAVPTYTVYDGIKVYVKSEKKFYVYDSTNTSDQVMDKWIEFTSGTGDIEPFETLAYTKSFTVDLGNDESLPISDLSGTPQLSDIHVGQYVGDKSGIIAKVISIDETNNEIKVRVITKDTIINTDTVHYTKPLNNEMGVVDTINYADLDTTETITEFSTNNLIYDDNGTLAKVLSKDITNSTLQITPVSVDIALSTLDVYMSLKTLDKTIGKQQTILFTDLDTSKLVEDIEKNQLVYDNKGTLAKIDNIALGDGVTTQSKVTITTITGGSGTSIEAYKYIGTSTLNKIASNRTTIKFTDLDTTYQITDIQTNQLVYDDNGTLTKIVMIDIPNKQLLLQTLTTSGMSLAPVLKELVIVKSGTGYQVGDTIQSTTSSIYGEVLSVGTNGEIEQVVLSQNTTQSVSGTDAVIDYSTVIYGASGNNWVPLHNTSTQVAQIVSEPFEYDRGYVYTIVSPGSGYLVGDVCTFGHNVEVVSVGTNGEILAVKYSRSQANASGSGANITSDPSSNVFIIPDKIWNNSKQNQFDITNDNGAFTTFNRLDNITEKYAVGNETIYKFTFDNTNGTITQEESSINASGSGIGPFIPQKEYKKDDIIINDNIIYICKDSHTSGLTLGDDISHWTEMRKQSTSGIRYVRFQVPKQTKPLNTWNAVDNITFVEGDQSMMTSDSLVAPVSGLYYLTVSLANSLSGGVDKHMILRITNQDNLIKGVVESAGKWESQVSLSIVSHLKAGEKLSIGYYYTAMPKDDGMISEFGLISDDRDDNLVAEADLIMPSSIAKQTYTTLTYENTSNLGIISTNGVITLPEDGSYMLSIDNLISGTGGTSGSLETILTTKDGTAVDALTTITHASCTKLQSAGFTHIITGSKGDTFTIKTYRSETQSNLTKSYDQKIRLFKIKSVDYHIDSHDLYKDSGSTLDYEDWIKSKLTNQQLTVKTTIDKSQTLNKSFMKYIYASGELSMFQDNKFIAPISGYYTFQLSPVVLNSSVSHSFALEKNPTVSSWKKDALAWSPMISANNANPGLNWFGWLNKDDYLMVDYYGSNNLTIDPQSETTATLTLVSTGLSSMSQYTTDKPHLWPDNQEVDLGDGLYGYKAVGVITAGANAEKDIIIPITGDITLINWNSWFKHSNSSNFWLSGSVGSYSCALFKADKVYYRTKTSSARTNFPYTVWLTYVKGGTN